MNPSTNGWINKFGSLVQDDQMFYSDYNAMYDQLRTMGFVYGLPIACPDYIKGDHKYSIDEKAKINLLGALYHTYHFHTNSTDFKVFIEALASFYKALDVSDLSFWDRLIIGKSKPSLLERFLHDRIQIDSNVLTRNFNKSMTNSLLFVDVLTFKKHLESEVDVKTYAAKLESIIINITYDALLAKNVANTSDKEIIDIFKSSITFSSSSLNAVDATYKQKLESEFNISEKAYFLDLTCIAIWENLTIDDNELSFIKSLTSVMAFTDKEMNESLNHVTSFFKNHKDDLALFKDSNFITNFYDNSSQLVSKLIRRNSKRISKEVTQSKELMKLLSQSTTRNLTKEEHQLVQTQLLDIFKTIPSLAIFMLPGGAILLPLFAKLIPSLLPTAFDDNHVEKEK